MRPVNKGIAPRVYVNYQDAIFDLQGRIGEYCSYCERYIGTHLAVEHIQPKSWVPALRNSWSNFLLACVNCNSRKGKGQIVINDHLWPDMDNTMLAIEYSIGGLVEVNSAAVRQIQILAENTIKLVGLDNDPGNPNRRRRPTKKDKRWLKRNEAWQLAEKSKQRLAVDDTISLREQIVDTALSRGLFSIWWTVFNGDQDMMQRLREAFIGTATNCFDPNENLISRAGGQT